MSVPKVRLYIRVVLPDGTRPLLDPVFSGNQKLKEGWAIFDGKPQRFGEAAYYLRYLKNGKRIYERLGSDAQQALTAKRRTELRLRAAADGIETPLMSTEQGSTPPRLLAVLSWTASRPTPPRSKRTNRRRRRRPTTKLCSPSLNPLIGGRTPEKRGNSPRTVANRIDYFQIFLHHFGLPSLKVKTNPSTRRKRFGATTTWNSPRCLTKRPWRSRPAAIPSLHRYPRTGDAIRFLVRYRSGGQNLRCYGASQAGVHT